MHRERVSKLGRVTQALALQRLPRPRGHHVLYNSFAGRFSDNPRAIYEELTRRGEARTHVWVADEPPGAFPPGVVTVPPYSRRYLEEVGHSRYVVSNLEMPRNFQKRRGVTYLQTWHGTPLKRIGYDSERLLADRPALRAMARDWAKWDLLVSQNAFSTEILRRAFRFEGEILETGYPRNDALKAPDRDRARERVRAQLGVAQDATVVLYAPTWRDSLVDEHGALGFSLALDPRELTRQLGEDHVLLLRLHYLLSHRLGDHLGADVRNVSSHPDIRELYLGADVLVTDYSSAMFDFAVTGKPMIFYTYDLAHYRDELRGFYFDLEHEAPGPLCESTDEVIAALSDLERVRASYADRYARFTQRFCHLDDGGASKRVVDRVFSD